MCSNRESTRHESMPRSSLLAILRFIPRNRPTCTDTRSSSPCNQPRALVHWVQPLPNATPQPADHTRQGTQPTDLGLSGLSSIGPYSTKRIAVILSISLCNSFNSLSPNRFSIQLRKSPAAMVAVPSSIATSRVLVSFLGKRSSGK